MQSFQNYECLLAQLRVKGRHELDQLLGFGFRTEAAGEPSIEELTRINPKAPSDLA
jgi:hypothetical protein